MIAVALLVVMGAATVMQVAGLSMPWAPSLAGVMLAESSYRHELEADIEPFRGILQALFFMAVGLSLQLEVITQNWMFILLAVPVVILVKGGVVYVSAGRRARATMRSASPRFCRRAASSLRALHHGGDGGHLLRWHRLASRRGRHRSMALTPAVTALAGLTMKEVADREELEEDFEVPAPTC